MIKVTIMAKTMTHWNTRRINYSFSTEVYMAENRSQMLRLRKLVIWLRLRVRENYWNNLTLLGSTINVNCLCLLVRHQGSITIISQCTSKLDTHLTDGCISIEGRYHDSLSYFAGIGDNPNRESRGDSGVSAA